MLLRVAQRMSAKAPADSSGCFGHASAAAGSRSPERGAYLKYRRSGAFWPFSVGIRKPSLLTI
jgi:hypothetical protein